MDLGHAKPYRQVYFMPVLPGRPQELQGLWLNTVAMER
jgi:hypothetical protein